MSFDIDVEVILSFLDKSHKENFISRMPKRVLIYETDDNVTLQVENCSKVDTTLDEIIKCFFENITGLEEYFQESKNVLRIGMYYSLQDTVVFPVILSNENLSFLSQFKMSLDFSGYACSD